jgi:hypothetical protein
LRRTRIGEVRAENCMNVEDIDSLIEKIDTTVLESIGTN